MYPQIAAIFSPQNFVKSRGRQVLKACIYRALVQPVLKCVHQTVPWNMQKLWVCLCLNV